MFLSAELGAGDGELSPTMAPWNKAAQLCYLGLKPSDNFLPRFHHRVEFASHHDGQALVLGQGKLNMSPRLLHDVHTDFGLIAFSKLAVVLIASLFQRNVKHLSRRTKHCYRNTMTFPDESRPCRILREILRGPPQRRGGGHLLLQRTSRQD